MNNSEKIIYLDNNATTQIDSRVLEEMMPFLTTNFANAASTHQFGVGAYEAVKDARKQVAELIGAETNEIVFTSGATEAINIAIKGVAESYSEKGKHIITVKTEHKAVLDTCEYLEKKGFEVTYLPVQPNGLIDVNVFKTALRSDTILVIIMHVNNETGVIQDIKTLSDLTHSNGSLFMSDCTQSVGKIEVKVDDLGIDLLCMSAHKIYGPKGVGALFVRQRGNRVKIPALLHGGGHERGLRSGTLNVPGIIGLGKACELAQHEMELNSISIKKLRDFLENELLKIEGTSINGNKENRIYNVSNIHFKGVDSDAMIMGLSNLEGEYSLIAVSNGSACTSASIDPSHVLLAMGLDETDSFCSVRFSIGKSINQSEIDCTIEAVNEQVKVLKAFQF
jgi:cysteine desulfurase